MTRERWIGVIVGLVTAIVTLILLALLDRDAASKVQVECMDPKEREKVRDIVLGAIDKGLDVAVVHLFDIWVKDQEAQPKRAMVGTNNAVNAHMRARKQAIAWDPPPCPLEKP